MSNAFEKSNTIRSLCSGGGGGGGGGVTDGKVMRLSIRQRLSLSNA